MVRNRFFRAILVPDLGAPIFIGLLGAVMFALAKTQPAWLDQRIGPGLFAQWLSAAVMGMSLVWLVAAWAEGTWRVTASRDADDSPSLLSGLGLLSGVAVFALAMPVAGMVIACALTALVVSLGAGERGWIALLLSAASGAGAALAIGLTLLPPGTRLWPPGF
ncbi:MAG: tripartite tricarboxylate transporter TctB family protein [Pseudomonadota bacterium]